MPENDTLEIHFVSNGCFHHEDRTIVIRKLPQPVAEISPPGMSANGPGGSVTLSDTDLVRLDRLLLFLRTNPGGGCTTRDDVTISWRSASGELAREHYVDESCATHDSEQYLSLWLLIRRTLDPSAA
jgi:hypothetical protein